MKKFVFFSPSQDADRVLCSLVLLLLLGFYFVSQNVFWVKTSVDWEGKINERVCRVSERNANVNFECRHSRKYQSVSQLHFIVIYPHFKRTSTDWCQMIRLMCRFSCEIALINSLNHVLCSLKFFFSLLLLVINIRDRSSESSLNLDHRRWECRG